jgi:ABC-type Fe3+-siderophore transport system permease subunit
VGVDPEPHDREPGGHHDRLGVRGRVIVGIAFFLLYAISFSLRGEPLPGIIGGILGGILVYLVFKEVENRSRRRRR